jgi:hypothetical protein
MLLGLLSNGFPRRPLVGVFTAKLFPHSNANAIFNITTNFWSSENEFKVLSRVAFATKVCDRLLLPCSRWQKLEIQARKTFESGPDFKVFFSIDRKFVVFEKFQRCTYVHTPYIGIKWFRICPSQDIPESQPKFLVSSRVGLDQDQGLVKTMVGCLACVGGCVEASTVAFEWSFALSWTTK